MIERQRKRERETENQRKGDSKRGVEQIHLCRRINQCTYYLNKKNIQAIGKLYFIGLDLIYWDDIVIGHRVSAFVFRFDYMYYHLYPSIAF